MTTGLGPSTLVLTSVRLRGLIMHREQVCTQLMSMMSVLDKSLATIHPDRNKVESAELRKRITEA